MQPVPDERADESKAISNNSCDHDESDSCKWIEWFNHIDRLDHVRPENEIHQRLRPAN